MTERPGGTALNASETPPATGPAPRGRGARSNQSGRYESLKREAFDDGWSETDPPAPQIRTVRLKDTSRSIISTNNSPDIAFDRTINPYKGCEHGCIYCYARPGHAYWGYSPGLDFESVIFTKPDAPGLLEQAFARPKYQPAPIVIGGDTDAYQPAERDLETTRDILKVFARYRHPVSVITKSALILRDLDILGPMGRDGLARAAISLTTLDKRLARQMEPRASAPHKRLDAIRGLAEAGVPVTVMTAPIIPALNDHEIERLLEAAKAAGARTAGFVLLRLPMEISDLFQEWLAESRPDAAARVMSLVRQTRGGKDYDSQWGKRGRGQGPYAELIGKRFRAAVKRLELNTSAPKMDFSQFQRPFGSKGQASLFD